VTNWDAVAGITGEEDSDDWPGAKLELYPTKVEMRGEPKDAARIRAPEQAELKVTTTRRKIKPPPDDDIDDEIPSL